MDVKMSSPGQECAETGNDRADGAGKLSNSQKRRKKKKLAKQKLRASLESFVETGSPKSKLQVPHQNVDFVTQSSIQDGLNTGQGTTTTSDQKRTVSSSCANGDGTSSISKTEGYMDIAKGEKGSSRTTAVDVNTRSKGEEYNAIANDKIGSRRNATLDVKTPFKDPFVTSAVGFTPRHQKARMDVKMSSPGEECGEMGNDRADGAGKLTKSQKRRKKKKLAKQKLRASLESFGEREDTGNPKSKLQVPHQNVDFVTRSSIQDGLNTGQGTTTTSDQKRTVSSSCANGDGKSSISKTEGYKGEKGSSRTTAVGAHTRSKGEEYNAIANDKRGSCRNAIFDVKKVSKSEGHTEITNGEMGCSGALAVCDANNAVSKGECHMEIANGETGSSGTAVIDANRGSTREEYKETVNGETVLGRTTTPDAKTLSIQEQTKGVNGAVGSNNASNLNVKSTIQKGKKQKSGGRKPTLGEILNPRYLEDMETGNVKTGTGTTVTSNTASKKRKRQQLKNTKPASRDSLNIRENTHDTVIAKKGSGTTLLEEMGTRSKTKDCPKVASGKKRPRTTTVLDQKGTTLKSTGRMEIANGEMGSSRTTTIDENGVSTLEECTKVGHGETSSSTTTTVIAKGAAPEYVKCQKRRKPTLGDILNPTYREELEIADENRALSKKMSRQKSRKKRTQGMYSRKNTEDKEIGKIIPVVASRKKLLIFDVNGLLADIVSPPPKDCKADKYLPKRAIFKRPFLDDFLCFSFERFNVGIWSSRTKKILDPVVDYLLGDLKKKLLFLWDASNCTNSGIRTLEDKHKCIVFKNLRKIWEKNGPSYSWVKGFFDESNTLLLDDSPYKALLNPKHTGIFPLSYSYKNTNDDFLGPEGDLRIYLEGVAATDNVKIYVEQHPFGQGAIDETSPHWASYSRVLKGQNVYAC